MIIELVIHYFFGKEELKHEKKIFTYNNSILYNIYDISWMLWKTRAEYTNRGDGEHRKRKGKNGNSRCQSCKNRNRNEDGRRHR